MHEAVISLTVCERGTKSVSKVLTRSSAKALESTAVKVYPETLVTVRVHDSSKGSCGDSERALIGVLVLRDVLRPCLV